MAQLIAPLLQAQKAAENSEKESEPLISFAKKYKSNVERKLKEKFINNPGHFQNLRWKIEQIV